MKKVVFILFSVASATPLTGISQTITIGNGTATNAATGVNAYPAPYGNWYYGARQQFIIRANEINASGVTGAKYINSLAFNVLTPSGTALNGFEIKLRNSTLAAFPPAGFSFQNGFTSFYGPASYKDRAGWNVHPCKTPFYWDGVSNLIVEVCFNNTSYTTNSLAYYSTASFRSSAYRYSDGPGNCNDSALFAVTKRPNMQLEFILPLPPSASFNIADSLWANVEYTLINTSGHSNRAYWNISSVPAKKFCNEYGCFMDSGTNLTYKFTTPGNYEITLVTKGFFGIDSVKKIVHVNTVSRKPQANFYASTQTVSTPGQVFFYDSSLYGISGWQWYINPECYSCSGDQFQYPNKFLPDDTVQNPDMYTFDAGLFDVCLKVWNDLGTDSTCKNNYLNVIKGYSMCNGSDSLSHLSTGYIYDSGGPDQNYQIGLIGQCAAGFVINPSTCSDTITLFIDRFRLRSTDTLQIRDGGTSTSPLIKKLSGTNLPSASKILKAKSGKMYLRMTTGSGTFSAGDSGFIVHWKISPGAPIVSLSDYLCHGDSMKLTTTKKADRAYSWEINGQTLGEYTDSFCYAKSPGFYKLIVTTPACIDSSSLIILNLEKARTDFTINHPLQCINSNNFVFSDLSMFGDGSFTRLWSLGDQTSSADSSVNKIYSLPGTYFISLVTVTSAGCKDSLVKYIRVADVPVSKIMLSGSNYVCENDSALLSSLTLHSDKYNWYLNNINLPGDTIASAWAKEAGAYSLKVTDYLGCSSVSASVNMIFKPQPSKPLITRNLDTLMSSAINGNHWFLDDLMIAGANQDYYLPLKRGKYTVVVDSNGCKNLSADFSFNFIGINFLNHPQNFINLFPNPATTMLHAVSEGSFGFTISDITGHVLLNSNNVSNTYLIDISSLSKGVYFMKAFDEEKVSVLRFEKF